MHRYFKLRRLYFILFGLAFLYGAAGSSTGDESLWLTALNKYRSGRYNSAATDLQGIIQSRYSSFESAARLLLGKCYLQQKKLIEAEKTARVLIQKFPQSRYVPYAHYLRAQVAFQGKDYFESAWQLSIAAQMTQDDGLNLLAREKLAGLFESYFDDDGRAEILRWVESPQILAELKAVEQGFQLPLKIGIIMALSGPNAVAGESILQGIEAACEAARDKIPHGIELIVRDSGGNVTRAVQAARALISGEGVSALIGGFDGPCSAAIAGVASENDVPLIVPSAQDGGLADIGNNVFQLMVDYRLEGVMTAEYVSSDLEAKRVAVLAPASEEGSQRVDGFKSHFENMGGEVVSVQWYYREATNYKRQLDDLVRIGANRLGEEYELTDEEIEKLIAWDEEPEEEESDEAESGESDGQSDVLDEILDSYVSPINYMNALYIPVQGEEISLLTPQVAASGFSGLLIGSSNCPDYITRESDRRYTDGMIFPANFSSPRGFSPGSDLPELFHSRTGQPPNRWHLLGWDAFNFLTYVFREPGRLSAKRIKARLLAVRKFKSERLEMVFPEGERLNHALYILNYVNGEFRQLKSPQQVAKAYLR